MYFFFFFFVSSSSSFWASRPWLILHSTGLPTQRPQSGSYVNINTGSQWVKLLLIPADTNPLPTSTWISVINSQMKGTGVMRSSQTWQAAEPGGGEEMKAEQTDQQVAGRRECQRAALGCFKMHLPGHHGPSGDLFSSLHDRSPCFYYRGPPQDLVFWADEGWTGDHVPQWPGRAVGSQPWVRSRLGRWREPSASEGCAVARPPALVLKSPIWIYKSPKNGRFLK